MTFTTNPVTPDAPSVSADDTTNTITGLDLATMEYAIGAGTYTQAPSPDLSGNKTVKVRIKAAGINPASADTTLTFTTNPVGEIATASFTVNGTTVANASTINVANGVASVAVVVTPTDSNATSVISGATGLVTGRNPVLIVVTAQDGITTQRYTFDVVVAGPAPVTTTVVNNVIVQDTDALAKAAAAVKAAADAEAKAKADAIAAVLEKAAADKAAAEAKVARDKALSDAATAKADADAAAAKAKSDADAAAAKAKSDADAAAAKAKSDADAATAKADADAAAAKIAEAKARADKAVAEKALTDAIAAAEEAAAAAKAKADNDAALAKIAAANAMTIGARAANGYTTIKVDLADKYSGMKAVIQLIVVKSGKTTYVTLGTGTLTSLGKLTAKTKTVIAKGKKVRVTVAGKVIKTVTK